MKVCLLYRDRERSNENTYYDTASIIKDLGLDTIFLAAAKRPVYENGKVKSVEKEDIYLRDTIKSVMMTPLATEDEVVFRQEVLKDCISHEDMIREMYAVSSDVIQKWNELGRGGRDKMGQSNPAAKLISDIRVLHLHLRALSKLKKILSENEFVSQGLLSFKEALSASFTDEKESYVRRILADISFYTEGSDEDDEGKNRVVKPHIVLECGLEDGMKFSSLRLCEVSSVSGKFYRHGSAAFKIREFMNSHIADSFSTVSDVRISEQAGILECGIVSYLVEELKTVMEEYQTFFDRLKFQSAFYLAAVQLKQQMERIGTQICFPKVCDRRDLEFRDLKEIVMGIERRMDVIGNSCSLPKKDLVIVTGANQGGKSTFLRSIGIAQVMMQCGLMVMACSYKSGIFPGIFVHFTRREDSQMNSGRLDEELGRMNKIIDRIGEGSLILLNESFATTTEKDGSLIAYNIIRAMKEAGVKILTVTHLLSFAKQVYEETKDVPGSGVEFMSAERKQDGRRTYHILPHAPELTSFGLDLYDEIIGGVRPADS